MPQSSSDAGMPWRCVCAPRSCLCRQLARDPRCHVRYFPTLLVVLLAVFNDGAMIARAKDRVQSSRTPNRWNLTAIFLEGVAHA